MRTGLLCACPEGAPGRLVRLGLLTLAIVTLLPGAALADGGDFVNPKLVAAAPDFYDSTEGGGAYDDGTLNSDIVTSLEGADFSCGDRVSYLVRLEVKSGACGAQTVQFDLVASADTTGQSGAAQWAVGYVGVNYGTVVSGDGPGNSDLAITDDGGSTATLISQSLTGPLFQPDSNLVVKVEVDDLEANEVVVVRIDVGIKCQPYSFPTGNMQGTLENVFVTDQTLACNPSGLPDGINAGNQTVNFQKADELAGAGEPTVLVRKTVTTADGQCPGAESIDAAYGTSVKYCFELANYGTFDLLDVEFIDDNGTPLDDSDDFAIPISGLMDSTNEYQGDADLFDDDLLAGQVVYASIIFPVDLRGGNPLVNTAEASGHDGLDPPSLFMDADTSSVNVLCPDADMDGFSVCDGDCDDNDPTRFPDPQADESVCDGLDNDCDGEIDEDYVATPTECGDGVCGAVGEMACINGQVVDTCTPGQPGGSDDDCDGNDDDCDGQVDEDFVPKASSCGVGACAAVGEVQCIDSQLVDSCSPGQAAPSDDTCDLIDDDCDGSVDEDYVGPYTACGIGACSAGGQLLCVEGQLVDSCQAGTPEEGDADCDFIDDDCDGSIDEDYVAPPTDCGIGACSADGELVCIDGALLDTCVPGQAALFDDTCDLVDDDCDGQIDEDYIAPATDCGIGACAAAGLLTCVEGQLVDTCSPGQAAEDDATCDLIDDDCDGQFDEDYQAPPTDCGIGACAADGLLICVAGGLIDTCSPGEAAEDDATCDLVDDDCDGQFDEDYVAPATDCGIGACAAAGSLICVAGQTIDTCQPGSPASTDATCDLVDDDCDGEFDEDYIPSGTNCGMGVCAADGSLICVEGQEVDTCEAGSPTGADDDCDTIDQDCDGSSDEHYVAPQTLCGIGECAMSGDLICVAGELIDTCLPGLPAPEICDGLDNNCDEQIDEDLGRLNCGIGECFAEIDFCIDGQIQQCVPGSPADEVCDGKDNDCDGAEDEELGVLTCGLGVCATKVDYCIDREIQVCVPLQGSEEVCDGLDNDCDGEVDEGLGVINCGVGECANSVPACIDGIEQECVPGEPSEELCYDGLDSDCDGIVDDGCTCPHTIGFWKNHPEDWPLETVTIGGVEYTIDEAISMILQKASAKDATYQLAAQLVGSILSLYSGGPDIIVDTIEEAQAFLSEHPLGSNPTGEDREYALMLKDILDDYNNGIGIGGCGCMPSPEVCDGHDNDCDGETDEGFGMLLCGSENCPMEMPACLNGMWATCPTTISTLNNDCEEYDNYKVEDCQEQFGAECQCPLSAGYWKNHSDWPIDGMLIGGTQYSNLGILHFILAAGNYRDPSTRLARAYVTAALNVAAGSPPDIVWAFALADDFLSQFPIGSYAKGDHRKQAEMLKEMFDHYNSGSELGWCSK